MARRGRPPGVKNGDFRNRLTRYQKVIKLFDEVMEDPEYQKMFKLRAKAGDLHPSVEVAMFHYLAGKPTETVDLNINDNREDLHELSSEELASRAARVQQRLLQGPSKQMN